MSNFSSILISIEILFLLQKKIYRASYSSKISNNSVPSSEELNLQHFVEIIYASTEFLSDLNLNEHRESEYLLILEFQTELTNLRVMDFSYNSSH